jgi:hypothetical protein
VSGVESSLRQVDIATGTISSKKAVKIGKAVKSSMGSARSSSDRHGVSGNTLDSSTRGGATGGDGEGEEGGGISSGVDKAGGGMDVSSRGAVRGKGGAGGPSEAMEQAQVLRGELERVQAGIRLLGSSVERLNDVVRSDTKLCGGVFEYLCGSCLGPSALLQWLPVGVGGERRQQGVYSSVSMDESMHNQL